MSIIYSPVSFLANTNMQILTLQTQVVNDQNKRGPSDFVPTNVVSPNKENPAEQTGKQVNYSGSFSIKHCKHAFDSIHPCKYALCPTCYMMKLTENDGLTRGTEKRSRRGGSSPADDDCKVHPVMNLEETTLKSYLPKHRTTLNEGHTLPETCFECGDTF
jgi:hypothetical protein